MNFLQTLNLETIVLLVAALALVILLYKFHTKDNKFDVAQIITNEEGVFSLSRFSQLVSMLVSTWVIIYQTRAGALTEWLFTGYMLAWAGANAFSKYLESKK